MSVATVPQTREEIRDDAIGATFPCALLDGKRTALVLFAAGFHGKQDAFWVAEAGLVATCVDSDEVLLGEMAVLYPAEWRFQLADAYEYAASTRRTWDVVTVDCPSGQFARASSSVAVWCSCARSAVVLGTGIRTTVDAPDGWYVSGRRRRSAYDGGVYWTVLERGTG